MQYIYTTSVCSIDVNIWLNGRSATQRLKWVVVGGNPIRNGWLAWALDSSNANGFRPSVAARSVPSPSRQDRPRCFCRRYAVRCLARAVPEFTVVVMVCPRVIIYLLVNYTFWDIYVFTLYEHQSMIYLNHPLPHWDGVLLPFCIVFIYAHIF